MGSRAAGMGSSARGMLRGERCASGVGSSPDSTRITCLDKVADLAVRFGQSRLGRSVHPCPGAAGEMGFGIAVPPEHVWCPGCREEGSSSWHEGVGVTGLSLEPFLPNREREAFPLRVCPAGPSAYSPTGRGCLGDWLL